MSDRDPGAPIVQPAAVVVIGLKEVYDAVMTLNGTVTTLVQRDAERDRDVADHEARIRAVERRLWALPTLSTLIALGSLAAVLLPKLSP